MNASRGTNVAEIRDIAARSDNVRSFDSIASSSSVTRVISLKSRSFSSSSFARASNSTSRFCVARNVRALSSVDTKASVTSSARTDRSITSPSPSTASHATLNRSTGTLIVTVFPDTRSVRPPSPTAIATTSSIASRGFPTRI